MKIILTCYTDVGNIHTPKGRELENLARLLLKEKKLRYVICRGIGKSRKLVIPKRIIKQPIPLGNKIPLVFSGIEKYLWHGFPARYISQRLFDFCSVRFIKKADALCCLLPSLPESLKKAKKEGMATIVVATSNPVKFNKKILGQEYKKFNSKFPFKNYFSRINKLTYRLADRVIAKSNFTKKALMESGVPKHKIVDKIIYSQVNTKKFSFKKTFRHKVFRVIFVGQVGFTKGVVYLLEAWNKLKLKNAELLIVGRIEPSFKRVINRYKSNKSIKVKGYVDSATHVRLLKSSSVFCLPSLTEGSPQAAAEAMTCGLPIIASTNSGSFIDDGIEGFIVPIRNPEAIAKKIRFFYENKHQIKYMGLKARKKVLNLCADEPFFKNFRNIIIREIERFKRGEY